MRRLAPLLLLAVLWASPSEAQAVSGECTHAWTFGPDGATLRDNVPVGGGFGSKYECAGVAFDTVYVLGGDGHWWRWDAFWQHIGPEDPGGIPQPWTGSGGGVGTTRPLTVGWDFNLDPADDYTVEWREQTSTTWNSVPVGKTNVWVVLPAQPGKTYCMRVYASHLAPPPSTVILIGLPGPPSPPGEVCGQQPATPVWTAEPIPPQLFRF